MELSTDYRYVNDCMITGHETLMLWCEHFKKIEIVHGATVSRWFYALNTTR